MVYYADSDCELNYEPQIDWSPEDHVVVISINDDGCSSVNSNISGSEAFEDCNSEYGSTPRIDAIKPWDMGNLIEAAKLTNDVNYGDFAMHVTTLESNHRTTTSQISDDHQYDDQHPYHSNNTTDSPQQDRSSSIIEQLQAMGAIYTTSTSQELPQESLGETEEMSHHPNETQNSKKYVFPRRKRRSMTTFSTSTDEISTTNSKRSQCSTISTVSFQRIRKMMAVRTPSKIKALKKYFGINHRKRFAANSA